MKTIKCELCGCNNLIKKEGIFECEDCCTRYTIEEAKKLISDTTEYNDDDNTHSYYSDEVSEDCVAKDEEKSVFNLGYEGFETPNYDENNRVFADEKRRKRKILKISISSIIGVIICGILAFYINDSMILASRTIFNSEYEMIEKVQGVYTHYSLNEPTQQININRDGSCTLLFLSDGSERDFNIVEWNYSRGSMSIHGDSEDLIINSNGEIDGLGLLLKKTGSWKGEISGSVSDANTGTTLSRFEQYLDENNITLNSRDVQYDMANNLGELFSLEGTATLDDYYNYGFGSNLESTYFCLQVTPKGGTYSDRWYIYCHRESFEKLYQQVISSGSTYVKLVCTIPSYRYKQNQNNMAELQTLVY